MHLLQSNVFFLTNVREFLYFIFCTAIMQLLSNYSPKVQLLKEFALLAIGNVIIMFLR